MVCARIIIVTMSNKKITVSLVLVALLAAVFLPVVFMGYVALDHAEARLAAQDYAKAAESFEQAARLLPWRDDLWEKAGIASAQNRREFAGP